jgi:hypothetical protein
MDDQIEVVGMSQLVGEDPLREGAPRVWFPRHGALPDDMELTLRYHGREYRAYLAGTEEAAARIGHFHPGGPWHGWEVKVTAMPDPRGGGQSMGPMPTLEAAIVSALTGVYVEDFYHRQRPAEIGEAAETEDVEAAYAQQRHQEEQFIQRDLARLRELEAALTRFHEAAGANPEVWQDAPTVGAAMGAASELRAVEHELCSLYLRQMKRDWTRRVQVARGRGLPGPEHVPATHMDPVRAQQGRALEAQEAFDEAIVRLQTLTGGEAGRHAEHERKARLRWLLTVLAQFQPEEARRIEETWAKMRARHEAGQLGPRLERWERQTGTWLARFLEPWLPA